MIFSCSFSAALVLPLLLISINTPLATAAPRLAAVPFGDFESPGDVICRICFASILELQRESQNPSAAGAAARSRAEPRLVVLAPARLWAAAAGSATPQERLEHEREQPLLSPGSRARAVADGARTIATTDDPSTTSVQHTHLGVPNCLCSGTSEQRLCQTCAPRWVLEFCQNSATRFQCRTCRAVVLLPDNDRERRLLGLESLKNARSRAARERLWRYCKRCGNVANRCCILLFGCVLVVLCFEVVALALCGSVALARRVESFTSRPKDDHALGERVYHVWLLPHCSAADSTSRSTPRLDQVAENLFRSVDALATGKAHDERIRCECLDLPSSSLLSRSGSGSFLRQWKRGEETFLRDVLAEGSSSSTSAESSWALTTIKSVSDHREQQEEETTTSPSSSGSAQQRAVLPQEEITKSSFSCQAYTCTPRRSSSTSGNQFETFQPYLNLAPAFFESCPLLDDESVFVLGGKEPEGFHCILPRPSRSSPSHDRTPSSDEFLSDATGKNSAEDGVRSWFASVASVEGQWSESLQVCCPLLKTGGGYGC